VRLTGFGRSTVTYASAAGAMSERPSAAQLLETSGGMLTRSDLRELGWERRAVDAIFREIDVVFLPGYRRGHVRTEDYLALLEQCSYRGDRVRPT
jgi:hypothetical protein